MDDINELKDQRAHALMSAQDILDLAKRENNRMLTDEETAKSNEFLAKADEIDTKIEKIKADQKQKQLIADSVANRTVPDRRQTRPSDPITEPKASAQITPISRYGSLKAFKGKDAEVNAYRVGMWLVDTLFQPGHRLKAKAHEFCREHGVHAEIRNALSTGIPASGGALVPDAMSTAIIDLRERYGIFRQWCDVMPMPNGNITIPRRSGSVTPYWTGEGVAITPSDPSWNNVNLNAKKLGVITRISTELTEDAIVNVADWLTMDIAQQFAYEEDRVGFNGAGAATDGGILGVITLLQDGNHAAGFYETSATHDLFSEIDNSDITGIMARCPQYARNGAAFFCSQVAADTVFGRLKASAGGNTIDTLASAGITALGQRGVVGSYLGYPVVASQVLPSVDAAGALNDKVQLLFGNLRLSSVLGETRSITFATDSSIYFAEDQLAVKATARLDIVNHSLGDGTTAGPLVGLKGSTS